jgi:glycosyltransferase involved in cell wall biosynthesis
MSLKVVFCWSEISGYMAACWRALSQMPDVEVFVVAFQSQSETAFSDQLMQGIPSRLLSLAERQNSQLIQQLVVEQRPDVVVLAGWLHPPYCQLVFHPPLRQIPFIMGMDTPWQATLKQRLAPYVLRSLLQRMAAVVVTGERSWQYAIRLGIPAAKIRRGLYGIDYQSGSALAQQRQSSRWSRSFLFVGRYAAAKAIDVLVAGYRHYRSQVSDPWTLVCCGQGSLAPLLDAQSGIDNRGFLQPHEMPAVWRSAGAFLLPSRFDPWPLALVEAAAAGLPIVCTNACGSAVEVVRSGYNGWVIPENDAQALAQAMLTIHQRYAELPIWGGRSQQLAAPYAADLWATRWRALIAELCQHSTGVDIAYGV